MLETKTPILDKEVECGPGDVLKRGGGVVPRVNIVTGTGNVAHGEKMEFDFLVLSNEPQRGKRVG